jgi:hypothetical protein
VADDSQSGSMGDSPKSTHEGDSLSGYTPPVEGQDDTWVPEDALEALSMEKQLRPAESNEELAERIFDENLPVAAQAICWLARNSGNAVVRERAARYVVERKMGKVTDPSQIKRGAGDPLLDFVKNVSSDKEKVGVAVQQAFREADEPYEPLDGDES